MEHFSEDQMQSLAETIKAVVREFYSAIEQKNAQRTGEFVVEDVFIFGSAADAMSIGREQFVADLRSQFERMKNTELRVQSSQIQVGVCDSGRSAWFFDPLVIDIMEDQKIMHSIPVRLTGLLVRDQNWRLAAAYWSIPLRSQEYKISLLQSGKIQAGVALEDQVAPEAQLLAQRLVAALAQLQSYLADLYSTHKDAVLIGSNIDEIYHATAIRNFIQEIASLPLKFAIRGGIRSTVTTDGRMAWMATHIDLLEGHTMPYRFFYIWLREQQEWRIVVAHDAVSIDPFNPGFDVP